MKNLVLFIVVLFSINSVNSQKKKNKDIEAIKKMCGCYEVTYNFAETFNYSKDSLYKPSKIKISGSLELAVLVEDENDLISIQHILQVGDPSNPMIVKHWRQDWLYENKNTYIFNANNSWIYNDKNKKEVKGQWTQKVFQVDDSPRYEGSGSWVHVDGKSYWENTTPAPLPRREYTIRSDYNLTMRGNRHEITKYGWLHDQDNSKIKRVMGKDDLIIAKEKGYNTYKKVNDNRCSVAKKWWIDNSRKWAIVRSKWEQIFNKKVDLYLKPKIDNRALYIYLFDDKIKDKESINSLIESFVIKK
ncbi:MAG: DUF6607 family protein [Flavobacteriaceae bacterium]|nr:MAG: hypothetical protein CBD80_000360 [Flavobacteriaceae bacterium TMED220]|tara:strand:+ start:94 stop:999 length:906 start_codon:yes stop_codon:yes gene_type:complete